MRRPVARPVIKMGTCCPGRLRVAVHIPSWFSYTASYEHAFIGVGAGGKSLEALAAGADAAMVETGDACYCVCSARTDAACGFPRR